MMTFRCRACGDERPDAFISVRKLDESGPTGLPSGVMLVSNYQYCNDRPACIEAAQQFKGYFKR